MRKTPNHIYAPDLESSGKKYLLRYKSQLKLFFRAKSSFFNSFKPLSSSRAVLFAPFILRPPGKQSLLNLNGCLPSFLIAGTRKPNFPRSENEKMPWETRNCRTK